MDKFSTLPLELLETYIFIHLSKKELSILSRTSTRLRATIEPILYREITWQWQRDLPHQPPIHLLVRTIISRPDLVMYIKKLDLGGVKPRTAWKKKYPCTKYYQPAARSTTCSVWDADSLSSFRSTEMHATEELILSLSPPSKDLWLAELKRGNVDVFVALLLSHLPSLQHLTLGSDFQTHTPFLGEVMAGNHGLTPKQPLPALQSVTYGKNNNIIQDVNVGYYDVDLNQVLPLFYMESLRTLNMSLPPLPIHWPQNVVPKSLLTSLVLNQSQVSEENLGHLLMATPQLRSLEFHFHFDMRSEGRRERKHWDYYVCKRLDNSLAHVTETLERLVLSVKFSSLQSAVALGGFQGMNHKVQSLKHFKKLKQCVIPFIVLLDWYYDANIAMGDLFPSSMERICFTDDLGIEGGEWTDDEFFLPIQSYLERRGPHELQLTSVSLEFNTSETSWCEAERARLQNVCEIAQDSCAILTRNDGSEHYVPGYPVQILQLHSKGPPP